MRQSSSGTPRHPRPPSATAAGGLVAACAASAGAHAGLVPEHLREAPALGMSFVLAVALLLAAAVAVAIRPEDRRAAQAAALLLAGLIGAWALSRTGGIPLLAPVPEPVDVVGVATKLVEAAGLALALWIGQSAGGRRSSATQEASR
jgi:hypothetical protein